MADTLGFKLTLDDRTFEIKMENAERLLNRFSQRAVKSGSGIKRFESGLAGFGRTLSGVITTIGMATFAVSGLKTVLFDTQKTILDSAGKLERLQVMLEGMAVSSDKATEAMRDFNFIVGRAKTAPFSIDAISDSFVKLKSAGIDPTSGSLNSLIDSVARFGGDSETLKRATVAIQQMSGKGVISMEELRQQLGEAVPTAMRSMALSMNMSMGDLVKAISSGQVRATEAIDSMLAMMEAQYGGSAERMMNTYSGLISQMETNATMLAKSIADSGYMDAVKDAIKDVNRLLGSDAAKYYGEKFGEAITGIIKGVRELLTWVMENQVMLKSLFGIILQIAGAVVFVSFLKTVIGGMVSLNRSIAGVIGGGGLGLVGMGREIVAVSRRSTAMGTSLNIGTVAIGRMSHAWRGLNAAMKANIIVAAIMTVVEVVSLLAWWFNKAREEAEGAIETAQRAPEMVTDKQLGQIKEKAEEQKKTLDKANKDLKAATEHRDQILNNKKSGLWVADSLIDRVTRDHKEALEKQIQASTDYSKAMAAIDAVDFARVQKAAREKNEVVEAAVTRERETLNAAFEEKIKNLEKQKDTELDLHKNNADKQKEISEKIGSLMREAYVERMTEETKMLAQRRDAMGAEFDLLNKKLREEQAKLAVNASDDQKKMVEHIQTQVNEAAKGFKMLTDAYASAMDKIKNAGSMFRGGFTDVNGELKGAAEDELTSMLQTVARNQERLAIGAKARSGAQIKMIDGRVAATQDEIEANFALVEVLKSKGVAEKDLETYYKNTSKANREAIDLALKNAAISGKDKQDKKDASSARVGESKAAKAKREAERLAAAHKKLLEDADVMSEKIGFGSQEVAKYDQDLAKLKKSLEALATAVPKEGILSQDQIDKAKARLSEIEASSKEYRNALANDSADQLISKWAGFANTVKSNVTQSVSEMRREFETNYNEADKYFQKIIAASSGNKEVQMRLEEEYARFKAGKTEAMVRLTETATARMAEDYKNVAGMIDENIKNVFDSLEDRLMDFLKTGEFSIKDFGDFIFAELQRTFIRSMVISPMINGLGLGAGGQTGEGMIGALGSAIGGMFGSGGDKNDPNAKATAALGKAATETTSAMQDMQEQGIFASIAGYAKQLWATITGTAATEVKTTADMTGAGATTSFAGAVELATGAVLKFMSTLLTQNTASSTSGFLSMASSIGGAVAGGMDGGAGAGAAASGMTGVYDPAKYSSAFGFANGGIMSSLGSLPLKAYSKGGIATTPQLALFGEGSHNEAYVPLPDGRRIPVNMNIDGMQSADKTADTAGNSVMISIQIENNGGEKDEKTNDSQDSTWNAAAQKIKAIVLETITEEKRPGGALTE